MSTTRKALARAKDDPEALDLNSYCPFFFTTIANRWTATTSREYSRRFDIGVNEWRVLAALSAMGQATSLQVVSLTWVDAAAVSRAMRTLFERHLVAPVPGRFKGRNKPFALTGAGQRLYLAVREIAFQYQESLLRSLDSKERQLLLKLLRKVHVGLDEF
jgi:DNA-binding MarR family transcriptional regulator